MKTRTTQTGCTPGQLLSFGVAWLAAGVIALEGQELDPALADLGPLVGHSCVGSLNGLGVTSTFVLTAGGRGVRRTSSAEAIGYSSDALFFWKEEESAVVFSEVTSRGHTVTGTVEGADGSIVFQGRLVRPEGETAFTNTLEIRGDGTVRDVWVGHDSEDGHDMMCRLVPLGSVEEEGGGRSMELTTGDGLTIHAEFRRASTEAEVTPIVILIHQGMSDHSEWDRYVPQLQAEGFATLAYDVRGHGDSDPLRGPQETLWADPNRAPLDLEVVLEFVRGQEGIDLGRIFVMGGSIGGNLAAIAPVRFGVRGGIALSPNEPEVVGLSGSVDPALHDVLYVSGSDSREGLNAGWADQLARRTAGRTELIVIPGSASHGVSLFLDRNTLLGEVVEWMQRHSGPTPGGQQKY